MLHPKTITLDTADGGQKSYVIHKFPAIAGREIVAKYPVANMPKVGDYAVSEEVMLKLMSFVGVPREKEPLMLENASLVDNHVPDWETLARLEWAMLEYNCSFFGNGGSSSFFAGIKAKLPQFLSPILTALSEQLSATSKQASTN